MIDIIMVYMPWFLCFLAGIVIGAEIQKYIDSPEL